MLARTTTLDGEQRPGHHYVFGDDLGNRVKSIKRAWQTAVLRAHGHKPVWIWRKKGTNTKGTTKLAGASQAAYAAIDLRFHDLRHEAGSRMIEDGWPIHHVKEMLGHASLEQTTRYLNVKARGLHESMEKYDRSRPACKALAKEPTSEPRPACKQAPATDENLLIH